MQMPRVVGEVSDQIEEEEEIEDNNKMNENMNQDEETTKFTPLDTKLITLSNLPASKWQSLPNLDLIKVFFFFQIILTIFFSLKEKK